MAKFLLRLNIDVAKCVEMQEYKINASSEKA